MSAPFPEEVAEFLKSNPGFFEQYADLIADIFVPHPHGGRAISLVERQIFTLREKNKTLEASMAALEKSMDSLVEFGHENLKISEKVQRLAVALIAADSLPAMLHLLDLHLRDDFAVPHVSLRFWREPAGMADLPAFAAVNAALQAYVDTLKHSFCGPTAGFGTVGWFGDQAPHIRSQALIPLRLGQGTIGLLALGSEDAQRFYAEMGSIFLEQIGEMVAAALARLSKNLL